MTETPENRNGSKFSREQLQSPWPPQSEIEWLHALEQCPLVRQQAESKSMGLSAPEPMLALWRELGRPDPVVLRIELENMEREQTPPLMCFLDWSWRIISPGKPATL